MIFSKPASMFSIPISILKASYRVRPPELSEMTIRIETNRFFMRPLLPEDATDKYLQWLREDSARRFIVSADMTSSISDLRAYIVSRLTREDVLFLGIFDKTNGDHLGNIKFEPINRSLGITVMGILIGDLKWQGKGVATEILIGTTNWLYAEMGILECILDVKRDNLAAIRAYKRAGFIEESTSYIAVDSVKSVTMVRRPHQQYATKNAVKTSAE